MSTRTKARGCGSKRRHIDEAAARAHIGWLRRGGAAEGTYHPYSCRRCGTWHIGHVPSKKRRTR